MLQRDSNPRTHWRIELKSNGLDRSAISTQCIIYIEHGVLGHATSISHEVTSSNPDDSQN